MTGWGRHPLVIKLAEFGGLPLAFCRRATTLRFGFFYQVLLLSLLSFFRHELGLSTYTLHFRSLLAHHEVRKFLTPISQPHQTFHSPHRSPRNVLIELCHRFGEYLRSSMIKEYYPFYIAYDDLKKALKTDFVDEPTSSNTKPARKEWTEDDETRFVSLLESELEKVFLFQKRKSEEIVDRIKESELEVNDVVSRLDNSSDARRHSGRPSQPPPTDADFLMLEQVLSDIIADVHDLAKFTQLNYTGFQKIIKKHDVCFLFNFRLKVPAR